MQSYELLATPQCHELQVLDNLYVSTVHIKVPICITLNQQVGNKGEYERMVDREGCCYCYKHIVMGNIGLPRKATLVFVSLLSQNLH